MIDDYFDISELRIGSQELIIEINNSNYDSIIANPANQYR